MLRAVTFGQCAFETSQVRIAPDSEIHFAILLVIAAAPPEGILRDDLVACIWPRADEDERRHRLRQAMYRLRQLDVPVHLRGGSVVLDWERTALDVHLLLHATPPRELLVRLGAVPFLPSYAPNLGEPFAHWLEALRARVATRLRRALSDEVTSTRGRGRFHEMGQVARALLALDPLNEVGTLGLAEALALEGSKVEALRLLEDYEEEVGTISADLQLPARILRRRVAEVLDDALVMRRFELPFVGREREFQALRQLLRDVRKGESHAAIITGEAGVGKSRLAAEVMRLAALDGATVATYTPSAGDTFTPVSTLVTVGQLLLTLPGALGCAQEHLQYVRRLGTPETVTVWSVAGMAADILYAQLVQALAELVMAIADEAPLVLFVDDAERLHPTTWRVLMDVWDRVGTRPVYFLFAARRLPAAYGSLGAPSCERLTHHIRLAPFANEESLTFVQRWGERNRVLVEDEAALRVATLSSGNPFYLSELVAHLGRGGDPQQTPPSIRDLIGAQHDVLSREARRVLLVVAILETRATTSRAVRLLEMPANDFMAAMDELQESGLVSTKGPVVWCRHRMVAALASELEVPSIVAFAHARAAAMLEGEADASQSVELLGDCVTHWEEAGEVRKAYEAAMKLGYRLVAMGMGDEACKAFVRAEGLAEEKVDKVRAVEGRLIALRLGARWYLISDAYEDRRHHRREMKVEPDAIDEFYLLALEGSIWSHSPSDDLRMVSAIASQKSNTATLRSSAALLAAMLADNRYDGREIETAYDAVSDLPVDDDNDVQLSTLALVYHCAVGEISQAAIAAARLARLASHSETTWLRVQGLRRAAIGYARAGDHRTAQAILEDLISLTERWRLPHQSYATRELLVDLCLALGEKERAVHHLNEMRNSDIVDTAPYLRLMLHSAEVRIAWWAKDASVVSHLSPGEFSKVEVDLPFLRHNMLANEVALGTLTGDIAPLRANVDELLSLHLKGRNMGRQDYLAEVLFDALKALGRRRLAARLGREYFGQHRRDVSAVRGALLPGIGATDS
ncbi:MAG: AAA family ATPase [Gemmatimonadaceae bacterium]